MTAPRFVTRFAPSPTGRLHRGHAFSALTAFDAAQAAGGDFLVRIEDIDAARCRRQFETAIFDDLAWLGLHWPTPVRRQSERSDAYRAAIEDLAGRGLLYRCFKTRAEVMAAIGGAPHGEAPAFFGAPLAPAEERRRLAAGEAFAWRLSLAAATRELGGFEGLAFHDDDRGEVAAEPERLGDVILARKDLGVSYHLACIIDDADQGVTHVIRGVDLVPSAHIHRLLQALLGLPTPVYRHHRLILSSDGRRLAKRDAAETLAALRARGVSPAALRAELGL